MNAINVLNGCNDWNDCNVWNRWNGIISLSSDAALEPFVVAAVPRLFVFR